MPAQDGVGREQGAKQFQLPAAEDFSLDGQSSPLIIAEQDPFPAELFFEYGVLGSQILDDFLLLAIDPTGKDHDGQQDHDEQLPRLQDECHRRLDRQAKRRRSLEFTEK